MAFRKNYVIVFFSQGYEKMLHTIYVGGATYQEALEKAQSCLIKDARYYDIFTQEQYERFVE